jgi:predicted RecA/RadA family phage recombinase
MAQNYVQSGATIDVVLAAAITVGDVLVIGNMSGVALKSGAIGDTISVQLEGVFTLKKKAPLVITAGDICYWDDTLNEVTKTSAGAFPLGLAWTSQLSADTTIQIKLLPKTA